MKTIIAQDMIPGKNYRGTWEGPEELNGVVFGVLTIVGFDPNCTFGTVPSSEEMWLMQVQYDAWAYPLPQVTTFSPFDIVEETDA